MSTRRLFTGALVALVGCRTPPLEHVRPNADDTAGVAPAGDPDVRFNEVRSDEPEFVELVNRGSGGADLAGWRLVVDGTCEVALNVTAALAAGERLPLWEGAALHCDIGESGTIVLYASDGRQVDELSWEVPFARHSWCRIPDADGEFQACTSFTPGLQNADPEAGTPIDPVWVWRFEGRASALADGGDGTVWIARPEDGLLEQVSLESASTLATMDLSHVPTTDDGEPGWRGLTTLADGSLLVSLVEDAVLATLDPGTGELTPWRSVADLGAPGELARLDDGSVVVSMPEAQRVACFDANGDERWVVDTTGDAPIDTPRDLLPMGEQLLQLDRGLRQGLLYSSVDGGYLGTVSGPASAVEADDEPGRAVDRIRGAAWLPEQQVLLLSDYSGGRLLGYDASDAAVLVDEERGWGYLGEVGRFGTADDELGSPRALLAVPDRDLVLVVDRSNFRVVAYDLDELVVRLAP